MMEQSNQKKVYAFVPSYNHAPFVEKCLKSIIRQTLPPHKLLVIDDGSRDGSPQVIEKILTDCPFDTELIVQKNRGLCATLNEGFAKSSGEYFAYLGSDDVWLPKFLEKRVELLDTRRKAVLAFGHAFLFDERDEIFDRTDRWTDFADVDMLPLLLRGVIFPSPGVVYRREALKKHQWNEDSVLEDYELYLKLSADGEFAFDKSVLCGWRQHESNVSGDFPLMLDEWIAAQNRVAEKLKISRRELDKIQTELKFDAVLTFVRHDERVRAARLFFQNLSGAKSVSQIAKTLFRFSIPPPFFRWNRRRKKRAAIKSYGKLEI
ncbi:MAG: glycosyltransferase family 2 protein [Pyrinomonadaceae bacterium]